MSVISLTQSGTIRRTCHEAEFRPNLRISGKMEKRFQYYR